MRDIIGKIKIVDYIRIVLLEQGLEVNISNIFLKPFGFKIYFKI